MKKSILAISVLFSISSLAMEINKKTDYLVKKGDTLWDISEHFLKDPWEWKTLWKTNPQIENPHLIYPDDLITLSFDTEGTPVLSIERNVVEKTLNLNKKVEEIHVKIPDSLPPVNTKVIKEFEKKYIMSEKPFKGRILKSTEGDIMSYSGDSVYIYDNKLEIGQRISSLREAKVFDKKGILYKKTGELTVTGKKGDVFIAKVDKSFEPIKSNQTIAFSEDFDVDTLITPKKTALNESATIIFTMDKINASKNDVVLLDKGFNDGITTGDVLKIVKEGEKFIFNDTELSTGYVEKGLVFVYKVDKNVSYAIIVKNSEDIKTTDMVISPFKEQ